MIRFTTSWLVVAALSALTSCYNPRELAEEYRFTRQRPHEADLVGRWVPTVDTLKLMRNEGGYVISTHELVLNADESFSLKNMPDWWKTDFGESKKGFDSGSGRWELSSATGDRDWGINLVVGTSIINFIHIRNQKPPYLIHIGIGDPDNGDFMLFQQVR